MIDKLRDSDPNFETTYKINLAEMDPRSKTF